MSLHESKERYTEHLLAKKNVVGVGEGDGEVVVLVRRKEPLSALATEDVVDPEIEGHPTTVLEVGDIEAHAGLRPGASLGLEGRGGTGTLGCLVMHQQKLSLLSNNHVIAGSNSFPVGGAVTHPGPADSSSRAVVARLSDFEPIVFRSDARNTLDAAVAEITDLGSVVGNDAIIFPVSASVSPGTTVMKTGRTTGTSTGEVRAVDVTVRVGYGNSGTARFVGQILTTGMSSPGDSGSVIRLENGRPVGLLFAGSDTSTVANPISSVFERFDLKPPGVQEEPGDTPPEDRPDLENGDAGPFVELLQELLRSHGYSIDRFDHAPFGPQTEAAVRDFQSKHGLPVTGVVDTATWLRLENPDPEPEPPEEPEEPPESPGEESPGEPEEGVTDLLDRLIPLLEELRNKLS